VSVHDWGQPLASAGGDLGPLPDPLATLGRDTRNVLLLNLGAEGKRLTADLVVGTGAGKPAPHHHVEAASRASASDRSEALEERPATPEDAEAIAQLLYENYHLSYVHGDFYRPRYLIEALRTGSLLSTVSVHEGRVIGHHALMPLAGVPSAETGAAVVHSAYRGLGVFGRMFEHTLATARGRGLASVFGDATTLHPFSQRAERSHGYRETALLLGMVPGALTMRGFASHAAGRRTATLRSYRPFDDEPRQASPPSHYRDLLESVYANAGLSLVSRTDPPDTHAGEPVTVLVDEARALAFLRLREWSPEARAALSRAVHHALAEHVDVVYADVDLVTVDDTDEAAAELNELGFFAAGLVLHGPDGHDHLRLQLLDSEHVELDEIVCDSPFAETLRSRVLADKARVGA
jgi:N-acetylglutamate synthase-like GNAT family acetyltransferase